MQWRRCLVMQLICLKLCMADDCTLEQCANMLPDLQSCVDFALFGGGDNWIALCSDGYRNFAVRFSVVQNLARVHKSPNIMCLKASTSALLFADHSPPSCRSFVEQSKGPGGVCSASQSITMKSVGEMNIHGRRWFFHQLFHCMNASHA